jgi:eukaryotic-like serine/threonine-protein kinase
MTGTYLRQYQLRALIGEGTFGTVYAAEHRSLRRKAAVKIMHLACRGDRRRLSLLREEARAVRALGHPHIAEILEVGQLPEGQPYVMTELIAGETLGDRLRRVRCLPLTDVLDFAAQAASTLGDAHERGIVHRGLTREDFFLIPDLRMRRGERVKLADFGMARLGRQRMANLIADDPPGSALYLAPEQLQPRRRVDHRADVYALGGLMYHALCGVPPFVADTRKALVARHLHDTPPPPRSLNPDVPYRLQAAILRALAKRPDERFESMEAFVSALRGVVVSSPGRRQFPVAAASMTTALAMCAVLLLPTRAPTDAPLLARGKIGPSLHAPRRPSIVQLPTNVGPPAEASTTTVPRHRTARAGRRPIREGTGSR